MQNDEIGQALDWASRLARHVWQIRDGRVSLDTPAHHILVKDVEQFVAMLKRRGYDPVVSTDEQGETNCMVTCADSQYWFRVESSLFCSVAEIAESFDNWLAQGWKHMACIQCGMPLLVSFKWLHEEGVALKWYGVCSVQAGPHSEHLKVCSGCGIEFSYPPPLTSIDDVSDV